MPGTRRATLWVAPQCSIICSMLFPPQPSARWRQFAIRAKGASRAGSCAAVAARVVRCQSNVRSSLDSCRTYFPPPVVGRPLRVAKEMHGKLCDLWGRPNVLGIPQRKARISKAVRQTAMYVEWGAGMREAEMADEIAERFSGACRFDVGCIKAFYRCLGLSAQAWFVQGQQPPLAQHKTTIDHDTIDGGAILRPYELPQRIAQRYVVDVPDIEEDDVRLVSRLQPADAIEAKDCSATFGRRPEYLLDRQ